MRLILLDEQVVYYGLESINSITLQKKEEKLNFMRFIAFEEYFYFSTTVVVYKSPLNQMVSEWQDNQNPLLTEL